jgi:hypothetical protein
MRLALLALASLSVAVPAAASPAPAPQPACVASVTGSRTFDSCGSAGGAPALSGATLAHDLRLTVLSGAATATLTCLDTGDTTTLTLAKPGTVADYVVGDTVCRVYLWATAPGTTAVATNAPSYVFR